MRDVTRSQLELDRRMLSASGACLARATALAALAEAFLARDQERAGRLLDLSVAESDAAEVLLAL